MQIVRLCPRIETQGTTHTHKSWSRGTKKTQCTQRPGSRAYTKGLHQGRLFCPCPNQAIRVESTPLRRWDGFAHSSINTKPKLGCIFQA